MEVSGNAQTIISKKNVLSTSKKELQDIHFLRAFASLAVCAFHLFLGNGKLFPENSILKSAISYGYLGVEIFFILSGFIICYALPKDYSHNNTARFLLKRLIRIEPPFIISIALLLVLNLISYHVTNNDYTIDWINILLHVAYINNFGVGEYLNVVYWTLGIEFQFYILIAIIFPFIRQFLSLVLLLVSFIGISYIQVPHNVLVITPYLPIFGIGVLIFFFRTEKKFTIKWLIPLLSLLLLHVFVHNGQPTFWACVFCCLVLFFWRFSNKIIKFFSTISFSLYLTHVVIGGKAINLGLRFAETLSKRYLLFAISFVFSISFAYIFYFFVEKPAMALAKKIHYNIETKT
ncbi:acyltransferase family protein [Desertivirga xinjiangensis]|uniref:acyltransferase family protein n=1 Tax=Desertivirga xinjiangensis TaxID=539206 RepID=UPI00210CCBA3|nr:acyltransferase [Pedobacter xinjiangensis]